MTFFQKNRQMVRIVLSSVMVLYVLVGATLWSDFGRIFSAEFPSYEDKRIAFGFGGFPVDAIQKRLNQLIPPESSVALGEQFNKNDFIAQRMAEGLYPRKVSQASPYVIDLSGDQPIAQLPNGKSIYLKGPQAAATPTEVTEPSFSILLFFILTILVVGFGFNHSLIASAVLLGTVAIFETWFQVALPSFVFPALGVVGLVMTFKKWPQQIEVLKNWFLIRENYILVFLLTLLFLKLEQFPIALWDGRSIWFFRAKELFAHGMFAKADVLHPEYRFAHPEYPLLLPAWLSYFSSFSSAFSERMAALGLGVLVSAILVPIWNLSRAQLGRIEGMAFTTLCFFAIERWTTGGYADGLVMLFLVLEFLALSSKEKQNLGWLAAYAASLTKFEGLVFGGLMAFAFLVAHPNFKTVALKKRALFLLPFLVSVIHVVWGKLNGLEGDFHGIRWAEIYETFFDRLELILSAIPTLADRMPFLSVGMIAFFGAAVCAVLSKRARFSFALGSLFFGITVVLFLITPRDLNWHVHNAMDRLLMHPSAFFILSIFFT